jgi:hypothetical protein
MRGMIALHRGETDRLNGPGDAFGNTTNRIGDGCAVEQRCRAYGKANEPADNGDAEKCAFLRREIQDHPRKGAERA